MKKKFFAIILAFAMLLTSLVSINDVSFAEENAFEIYEGGNGTALKRSNNVDDISTFDYKDGKAYTIKVLNDLEVSANGGHLKTITLNGNITVEGNGHTITGARDGAAGDRLIKIMPGNNVIINKTNLDGKNKYAGILAKAQEEYDHTTGASTPAKVIYFSLNNSTIEACTAINSRNEGSGGALYLLNVEFKIDGTTIKNCKAKTGGAMLIENVETNVSGKIIDSILDGNSSEQGGAIFNGDVNLEIINSKIINNAASQGAGILHEQANLTLKNTIVSYNKALSEPSGNICIGAGIFINYFDGYKVSIDGGEISYNHSDNSGGGIYADLFSFTEDPLDYITIGKNVIFKGNTAGDGYYNPPQELESNKNFTRSNHSLTGRLVKKLNDGKWVHVESLVNNYDIEWVDPITTITYDPNGGSGDLFVESRNTEYDRYGCGKAYTLKVKSLKDTNISNFRRFLGWNTEPDGSGTNYAPGQNFEHKGNLYLFAQWKKPEPSTLILTLDENYRGGEITNIEVEEGELIEPHLYIPRRRGYIFRGWSYDQKHLDEVKPGDRIYTDTTLYAIWKRAEEERVEEPEEIKGEDHKTYIFGYPDGSVRPNGSITRAEAAAMLARLLNIEAIGSAAKPNFTDTESSWYNKAINAVVFRGIMKGYPDGRFRPNAPITRAEFTQMISTIDNKPYGVAPFADVAGHWAERAIGSEYQAKRITGYPDGLFRPDANITRAEAAVILNKIFERNYDNLSLLKCKNPQMIKRFTDLDESFWGWNDMVEATNTHEYVRRYKEDVLKRVEEDWLLIKDINDIK